MYNEEDWWYQDNHISLYADHFSFFDITAEWPNTTQIAAILSSDGTNNVYMRLRL